MVEVSSVTKMFSVVRLIHQKIVKIQQDLIIMLAAAMILIVIILPVIIVHITIATNSGISARLAALFLLPNLAQHST